MVKFSNQFTIYNSGGTNYLRAITPISGTGTFFINYRSSLDTDKEYEWSSAIDYEVIAATVSLPTPSSDSATLSFG
jgi:hypothetical protein